MSASFLLASALGAAALFAPIPSASKAPQLRDSGLPLADKRVLVTSPRVDAAPLTAALVAAGARPLWYHLIAPTYCLTEDGAYIRVYCTPLSLVTQPICLFCS